MIGINPKTDGLGVGRFIIDYFILEMPNNLETAAMRRQDDARVTAAACCRPGGSSECEFAVSN
ncbi:hypothetical protein [Rhodopila sp.]|uniref:hypothetical protein n=1 Tax=Rhodopila sp. TaxID=2480087 RepID=UPI003D114DE6